LNRKNLLVVLMLALGVGAAGAALAWHRNRPVARVNSQSISSAELSRELHERFGAEVLQDLVNQRLVAQAAEEAGLAAGRRLGGGFPKKTRGPGPAGFGSTG
jgi:hypothetical protein